MTPMPLRLDQAHAEAAPPSLCVPFATRRRDPRTAAFVLTLVAASPADLRFAVRAFALRFTAHRPPAA